MPIPDHVKTEDQLKAFVEEQTDKVLDDLLYHDGSLDEEQLKAVHVEILIREKEKAGEPLEGEHEAIANQLEAGTYEGADIIESSEYEEYEDEEAFLESLDDLAKVKYNNERFAEHRNQAVVQQGSSDESELEEEQGSSSDVVDGVGAVLAVPSPVADDYAQIEQRVWAIFENESQRENKNAVVAMVNRKATEVEKTIPFLAGRRLEGATFEGIVLFGLTEFHSTDVVAYMNLDHARVSGFVSFKRNLHRANDLNFIVNSGTASAWQQKKVQSMLKSILWEAKAFYDYGDIQRINYRW